MVLFLMLHREKHLATIRENLKRAPIAGLLGPRQCGKSTLARQIAAESATSHWFDLEDPDDLEKLKESSLALKPLTGLVILDEVQRMPELFPLLRVLADRDDSPAKFLILGSASPDLRRQSAESLAGRVAYHYIDGFKLNETGLDAMQTLWLRGGFPRSYLAETSDDSMQWRSRFSAEFLERDLARIGFNYPSETMRRFWTMLAHRHAQPLNKSELAGSLGISQNSIRRYVDALSDTFMVRQLYSWHENLEKRQVRAPKVYLRDSGMLHSLLRIDSMADLQTHPKLGASWEGFVIENCLALSNARVGDAYFWGTQQGAELDLLLFQGSRRLGVEVKHSSAPSMTPSMRIAMKDLKLDRMIVVHRGDQQYPMAERITAVPLNRLEAELKK